jgi:hypothetical protein
MSEAKGPRLQGVELARRASSQPDPVRDVLLRHRPGLAGFLGRARDLLASVSTEPQVRHATYSVLSLLDLADAALEMSGRPPAFSIDQLLPPRLTWAVKDGVHPDIVKRVTLPKKVPREAAKERSDRAPLGMALRSAFFESLPIDEDPARIRSAMVMVEPPPGTARGWGGRVFGVSINGSVEILLRDRGHGRAAHWFEPSLLHRGVNTVSVFRSALLNGSAVHDEAPWTLRIELVLRKDAH